MRATPNEEDITMSTMTFRLAAEDDAARLLAVYAPYLATSITFETEIPSEEEFRRRIRDITSFYPYLVCEQDGNVLGYAYAHRQLERAAYRWNAELSVYLAPDARGNGLGETLYRKLIDLLRLQHIQTVYAIVTSPNPRSERLHERMGFVRSGFFREAGFKDGEWHHTSWYDLVIGTPHETPHEIVSLHDLPADAVAQILAR
jgi:phosphinothricin acetyltransferase